jgi:hypothetical protein
MHSEVAEMISKIPAVEVMTGTWPTMKQRLARNGLYSRRQWLFLRRVFCCGWANYLGMDFSNHPVRNFLYARY